MSSKERADVALVRRNLCESREKAQAAIMAGCVYAGQRKILKASESVMSEEDLVVRDTGLKYVSRGALKLEKALKVFQAVIDGRVIMDIGASTGGFTDVCLRSGARHVYSIDVGYGQLDWKLRNDPRVVCLEKTNIRYATREQVPEEIALSSIDVSFISLSKVLPAVKGLLSRDGEVVALIKPQFEAGREQVGKHGVVRDPAVHCSVIRAAADYAAQNGFTVRGLTYSPIRGPEGNIEYLYDLSADPAEAERCPALAEEEILRVVQQAHRELDQKKEQQV